MTKRPPTKRPAYLDKRTRAVGGPPLSVRNEPYNDRNYGRVKKFLKTGRRLRLFVSIESVPDMSQARFRSVINEIDAKIKRYAPDAMFVSLICAVFVGGPSVYSQGERVAITTSNGDAWVPTDGWEVRMMYRNPLKHFKIRRFDKSSIARDQLTRSIVDAADDHSDNRWIYIIGAEIDLVWFRAKRR